MAKTVVAYHKVPTSASRQEEIDALRLMAGSAEPGTYLREFFTDELLAWFEQTVDAGVSPDLHESWAALKTELEECIGQLNRLRAIIGGAWLDGATTVDITALRDALRPTKRP